MLLLPVLDQSAAVRYRGQFQPIDPATGQPAIDPLGNAVIVDWAASPDSRYILGSASVTVVGSIIPFALGLGQGVVGFQITGLTVLAAVLTPVFSNDGGNTWHPHSAIGPSGIEATITADGAFRVSGAGHTNVGLQVTTTGAGTISIVANASVASGLVEFASAQPIKPSPANYTNSIVVVSSVGTSSEALITSGGAPTGRFEFFNNGETGTVWVNPAGGTAVVGSGIPVYPRGSYLWANGLSAVPTGISDNSTVATSGAGGY